MPFKKENVYWKQNIGAKRSLRTRKKLSKKLKEFFKNNPNSKCGFQKGHIIYKNSKNTWFKKNNIPWNKGKQYSEKIRKKISDSKRILKDNNCNICNKIYRPFYQKQKFCSSKCKGIYLSKINKGKKLSEITKLKIKEKRKLQILPNKDTSIEIKIQNYLKQLGISFFTHQYMKIEHGYQCDILIPSMKIVIECDGDYWHKYPIGNDVDHIRTDELIEKGFKVLRLWECEIRVMNINEFKEKLKC